MTLCPPSVCQRKGNDSLIHMNKRGCLIYQFHFIVSHFSLQLHQNGCRFTDKKTVSLLPSVHKAVSEKHTEIGIAG